MPDLAWQSATEIAASVTAGTITARAVVDAALNRIAARDGELNAFTDVTADRARARAAAIDAERAAGNPVGPLAGVPFAVKNLFDVEGLPTRAGSAINRERSPATRDQVLVTRLERAGAVLVGALNMGEYAYDFTGENCHDGPSRNPHDTARMTGGSSGGSGAAVAGGLVPLSLGSDTNGSIRVPASLCGLFGLKPTFGRLPRTGSFPFVSSLDHLGPLARTVGDLAAAYDAMQGHDTEDPFCAQRLEDPVSDVLDSGISGLRIAEAGGYFRTGLMPEAVLAVRHIGDALKVSREVELPAAGIARAAAYLITTAEGAALHLPRLRERAADFDPDVRDRLIAGAMVPAAMVIQAQKFRRWYQQAVLRLFEEVDAIIALATPCSAPLLGQKTFILNGEELPVRANLGLFTQPISFIGLPVVAVPVAIPGAGAMPIGVQIIAAPWREDVALRIARHLEVTGVAVAPRPTMQ
jgi:aspartyl-tRNA(Asn)/glutamyl-tRNA(Gln) amidotransferase subunit A